jgi:phage gpG-like protein
MPVSVKLSRNFGPLKVELTEADMREAGALLVRRIRTRTENGVDVNGAAFRDYSAGYAEQKRAALGHARVDLTVSGQMLNDMQVTSATNNTATISFTSQGYGAAAGGTFIQRSRAMGAANKAAFNNPSREFFGASEEDEQAIVDGLEKLLTARLNQE